MSLPWGTATSRYLIFSPVFLRLARPLPPCTGESGFEAGVVRLPGRAQPPCAHGIGGDTRRLRSEQKLWLGRRAEPRSAETHEGLQEHKRSVMHLSYEATPSPNLTNGKEEKPPENPNLSSTGTSPWPGDATCTGTPPTDFGRFLSRAGHRDATLQCGARGCSAGQRDSLRPQPRHRAGPGGMARTLSPRQALFWGISLLSGRI